MGKCLGREQGVGNEGMYLRLTAHARRRKLMRQKQTLASQHEQYQSMIAVYDSHV